MARSVPWPVPVRANDPCSSIFAVSGVPPISARAISPSRHAPAVCDDDGPTMTGPMISRRETISEHLRRDDGGDRHPDLGFVVTGGMQEDFVGGRVGVDA